MESNGGGKNGGEAGIRTLLTRSTNPMTARDKAHAEHEAYTTTITEAEPALGGSVRSR